MQDRLGFPDKQDPAKWSVFELNDMLHKRVVPDCEKWLRVAQLRMLHLQVALSQIRNNR